MYCVYSTENYVCIVLYYVVISKKGPEKLEYCNIYYLNKVWYYEMI